MNLLSPFTVLIERRIGRRLVRVFTTAMASAAAMVAAAAFANPAHAGTMARDLESAIDAAHKPQRKWVREVHGVRHVQAIVIGDGSDPEMLALRRHVLATGGSVHAVFPWMNAVSVQIRANQVRALANRKDVLSVSPNRETRRTASTLESITGALGSNVRSSSTKTSYSGLDGTGIGIAVLDSGVMKSHDAFLDGSGNNRVKRSVNMRNSASGLWTGGMDATSSLKPGTGQLAMYETAIANDGNSFADLFGHGTHVAAVAAGRAKYYLSGTPDTTGIAPNANLYAVKVLGDDGSGTVADVLEGIQWVIFNAKVNNIRVMNLSLATSSTESWRTDPLCVAVRSATAAGITVVVAAGNYGKSDAGTEVYGTIGAPGNDPSVITVGSVNYKATVSRADDGVNMFS